MQGMVLLAMDGAAFGEGLAHALHADGWDVRVAQDATQALERLFDELPTLLVVVEPLCDGRAVELVAALRRMPGGLVPGVIVVTTDPTGGDETVDRWVHPSAPWGTLTRSIQQVVRFRGLDAPPAVVDAVPAPAQACSTVSAQQDPPVGRVEPHRLAPPLAPAPPLGAQIFNGSPSDPPPRRQTRSLPAPERPLDESGGLAPVAHAAPDLGLLPAHMLTRAARERLAHEVHVVEGGDPWAALGVPRRSPVDLVERAAARMEARYTPYLGVPDPIFRDLGARMLACVRSARRRVVEEGLAGPPAAGSELGSDPLAPGHALLAAGQWQAADVFFTTAREEHPDSAAAMAGQGWARFNNPSIWRGDREKDGESLMELAVQFDVKLSDTQARLARIAQARGRPEIARARALLALKQAPGHAEALAVLRDIGADVP